MRDRWFPIANQGVRRFAGDTINNDIEVSRSRGVDTGIRWGMDGETVTTQAVVQVHQTGVGMHRMRRKSKIHE